MQTDAAGTLRELRKIGYRVVESAGFGKFSAKEFRGLLDDANLVCPSAHLNFMSGDVDALLADAPVLGAKYVVSSILRPGTGPASEVSPMMQKVADWFKVMTLDDAKQVAELANRMGERARRAGLQFVYHNHFFEFADQGNGQVAYDVLLRECSPDLVQFEIDCGWMRAAGFDPVQYLNRYPARFPMIHVKDFLETDAKPIPAGMRVGTELGHGFIDYRPIFRAAKAEGLKYYFAEQEGPFTGTTQLAAAKVSYDYLHSIHG
jgi:sugar phosphate isomerase/epimerase